MNTPIKIETKEQLEQALQVFGITGRWETGDEGESIFAINSPSAKAEIKIAWSPDECTITTIHNNGSLRSDYRFDTIKAISEKELAAIPNQHKDNAKYTWVSFVNSRHEGAFAHIGFLKD